jgi:hypothetical protein
MGKVFSTPSVPRCYKQGKFGVRVREVDFFIIILSGVRLSPLGTAATTGLLYQTQMIDDGDWSNW